MVINVIVQYNGGFLPNILLLTQAPIFVWFDGTIILPGTSYIIITTMLDVVLHCFCFVFASWLVSLHGD